MNKELYLKEIEDCNHNIFIENLCLDQHRFIIRSCEKIMELVKNGSLPGDIELAKSTLECYQSIVDKAESKISFNEKRKAYLEKEMKDMGAL